MHSGSCLCGAVKFEVDGELAAIQLCHCGMCRRASGTAFASNIPIKAERFRLVAGDEALKAYVSSPGKERLFCGHCGSQLFSRTSAHPGALRLRAGALDEPAELALAFHFHVASKAGWWPITDDLPQHPGPRPPGD